jgi:hypothetical protein
VRWRWRYEALTLVVSICDFMVCYDKLVTSEPTQTLHYAVYSNCADVTERSTHIAPSVYQELSAALCIYAPREQLLRRNVVACPPTSPIILAKTRSLCGHSF